MRDDEERTSKYASAIRRAVASQRSDSVVVAEIGTGPFALLAVLAARAGARRVYALERSTEAAAAARRAVAEAGQEDIVRVVEGDSTKVELPERVDLVISELIGNIALGEGVVSTIRDARRRFLRPPRLGDEAGRTRMVPRRCQTMAAPVAYTNHALLAARGAAALRPFKLFSETQDLVFLAEPQPLEDFQFDSPGGPGADDLAEADQLAFPLPGPSVAAPFFSGFALWPRVEVDREACIDIRGRRSHWSYVVVLSSPEPIELPRSRGARVLLRSRADISGVPYRYQLQAAVQA